MLMKLEFGVVQQNVGPFPYDRFGLERGTGLEQKSPNLNYVEIVVFRHARATVETDEAEIWHGSAYHFRSRNVAGHLAGIAATGGGVATYNFWLLLVRLMG